MKKILILGALFIGIVGLVGSMSRLEKEGVLHKNLLDTKISQYSDKHITPNAIVKDKKFESLAFESVEGKSPIFSNQIAAVVRAVKSFTKGEEKDEKEYGSWIWTPVLQMTPQYMDSVLKDAREDGVNVMYVSIDSYLDIFTMPKGKERERQKKDFGDRLEYFITLAQKYNIEVDAEGGWRNWAETGHTYKAFAIVNFVRDFNATHQNKIRGFQYDVEPYLLDSYVTDQSTTLRNFVKLVDETESFLGDSELQLSVVVPDFFDEGDGFTEKFAYNGRKESVFKHLLNILEGRAGSSIIIMSYRNFAEGEDSAIEISENEMQTAKKGLYNTKIIIAQETGAVPPPYITFHNTSKKYFSEQVGKINSAFLSHPNFGGIAVHYVNAFLALR